MGEECVPSRRGTRVIAIVGPTGAGKSAIARSFAERIGGAIVGADSMQVYRGMDIGTAKTPPEERVVPHACIDIADPGEPFSAALYQRVARSAIDGYASRGLVPIVCGGTGLYVRAALDDWSFPAGSRESAFRREIEALAEELGPEELHSRLAGLDPESAAMIHPNNVRRVTRALEMLADGTPYHVQASGFRERRGVYDAHFIGLEVRREVLYARIDSRVDAMVESGLLDEVRRLLDAGHREALTSSQAIGYKEMVSAIEGVISVEQAIDDVKRATRRYAKRQMSWFRADPRVRWLDVTDLHADEAAERALSLLES